LSTGLGLFFAIGSFEIVVPDAGEFQRDDDAIEALRRTVARIAGDEVDESTIELTLPCDKARRLSLFRRLDDTVGVCFRISVRGEEASTNVCQRLSGFGSQGAQRILAEELSDVPGRSVQVVNWQADPNPVAYNPNQNAADPGVGFSFDPSAGIALGAGPPPDINPPDLAT